MMTVNEVRAGVDQILTQIAQGFEAPTSNIANFIAPVVGVSSRTGRVLRFGKEAFAVGDHRRAYGKLCAA